ncbi:MAG: 16S rRNA (uracil(1498)-N(3))-methyltransferase [Clostridia bacterium]|nr:16S rRNA (uracil(1498)-N(3))-methyltransferase [Clostridia bacterium]
MYNFFVKSEKLNNSFEICGGDFNHIKNVLRMKVKEQILVTSNEKTHLCEICEFSENSVIVKILEENYKESELPIKIYLFQGLPKSDKMELVIQKAVELGVYKIVPVEMKRCVVKLDGKKKNQKTERYNAIAEAGAKQSKRNIIPTVENVLTFNEALELAKTLDLFIAPYESEEGIEGTKIALSKIKSGMSIGIIIGPEGGFDDKEIEKVKQIGGEVISLGKRILRTETASITALSMLMLHAEMYL